ncbi:FolC bifunctional protein [Polyplosphaeria fusca]|uniref:FolC bifunctional protein n=1 Tax=Polyplosphaeria fusca TaxID=682080 RepID=A0A9P4V5H7_9PLEO|nr:FolC bifunctional protein [Polyplosphaeria fusca]
MPIQPGLERIGLLLKGTSFPWKSIHVAGTNGKGSICAWATHLFKRRCIKAGTFTSPHLINRWDCIQIDGEPVEERRFRRVENYFKGINEQQGIGASEFELLTATAFQLFNDREVQVGIVEVGMGGKLDATNILQNQVVSVISKIARDHEAFLGNTIEEIAQHKAGILRPNVPYLVNPANEWNVQDVILKYARDIGAGPRLQLRNLQTNQKFFTTKDWKAFAETRFPFERDNAVLAYLAFLWTCEAMHFPTPKAQSFLKKMRNRKHPGRLHDKGCLAVFGPRVKVLIDGAHNEDAALALSAYIKRYYRKRSYVKGGPDHNQVVWVLAMTEGKDVRKVLTALLEPGDSVVTTTFGPVDGMPWVKPMDPVELLKIAQEVQPDITGLANAQRGAHHALCTAKYLSNPKDKVVLAGSLYLCGDFYREADAVEKNPDALDLPYIHDKERGRVNRFLSKHPRDRNQNAGHEIPAELELESEELADRERKRQELEDEIKALERQIKGLDKPESQGVTAASHHDIETIYRGVLRRQ